MATVAVEGAADRTALATPYPPSWMNRLMGGIDRLPGPAWVFFIGFAVVAFPISNSQYWLSGQPIGTISVTQSYYAFLMPGMFWLIHHLDRVARDALATFRPALAISDEEADGLLYQLTTIPARPAAIIAILAVLWTIEAFVFQPEGEGIVGLSPVALAVRAPFEAFATAIILVLLYHTLRQMRLVGRIHAMAPHIDLYQPAPLYAFSNLTARTGIGLVLLLVPTLFLVPPGATAFDYAVLAAFMAILVVIAAAAFVLPLQGMHRRLVAERHRLQGEVGRRITTATEQLHRSVDEGDLADADALNKTLGSLIAEREMVHGLSTWPWQPGTLGAFLTAIMLPIGLWLVTRVLEKVI